MSGGKTSQKSTTDGLSGVDIDYDSASIKSLSGLVGDRANVALLTSLYVLQGIPLGLSSSIPYLLQDRHVSYKDQAVFSLANWPFSVKLLWAPIVDSVFCASFGRRKTWLVPAQYLIGVVMLLMARGIDDLLGSDAAEDSVVNVSVLTGSFLLLNLLAATQDVAVDGWALTMLSRRNVSWASTCNTVGQSVGFLIGNVVFLALESADFCNKYIRYEPQDTGIVTLQGFLLFWGTVFCVSTTLLMLFKSESRVTCQAAAGVVDAYQQLLHVVCLPPVRSLVFLMLTSEVGFAVAEALTSLKLIAAGIPKEHLALMSLPLMPIEVFLPLCITRWTSGPRPLDFYLRAFPFRLAVCLELGLLVSLASFIKSPDGHFPAAFYPLILLSFALQQVAANCMFVTLMAFFTRISDPSFGGTYMTLLNTVSNLGVDWPLTLSLWFADHLSWTSCPAADGVCLPATLHNYFQPLTCSSGKQLCVVLDGYYVELIIAFVFGLVWLKTQSGRMRQLQNIAVSEWTLVS